MDYVLTHHGIRGQKWGVRRYQNMDGSLTDAGKKRYRVDVKGAEDRYKKTVVDSKERGIGGDERQRRKLESQFAKQDLKSEKNLDKINKSGGLTEQQQKYAQEYRKKGMNEREAAVAAYNRDRTQKALMTVGGLTLAAAATYGAYKYKDYISDELIPKDMKMYRVSPTSTAGVHDGFYAAFGKKDPKKYVGMYGSQLHRQGKDVYQKTLKTVDSIKIASDKNAHEVFKKYVSGMDRAQRAEFDKFIRDQAKPFALLINKQGKVVAKGVTDIQKGKNTRNAYKAFNLMMGGELSNPVVKGYVDTLKKQGYSGIRDINDRQYSGYNAKSARIMFDAGKVAVDNVRSVPLEEVNTEFSKIFAKDVVKAALKLTALGGIYVGSVKVLNDLDKKDRNDEIVKEYKKKHPNTELSYNEIVRNYERAQLK